MAIELSEIRSGIERLTAEVSAGQIGRAKAWGGADVIIAAKAPGPNKGDSFYPDKRVVVTPFAHELSWIFESLRDVFKPAIDFQSKFVFFGRLADAAERRMASPKSEDLSAKDLLLAVLGEAQVMAGQLTA
jgi:hypothetical protein